MLHELKAIAEGVRGSNGVISLSALHYKELADAGVDLDGERTEAGGFKVSSSAFVAAVDELAGTTPSEEPEAGNETTPTAPKGPKRGGPQPVKKKK